MACHPNPVGWMGHPILGRRAETEASESETERAGLKSGAAPEQVCLRLEAEASAELDFAARRGYFRDAAEARGVYEAVGCAEIGVVESVEEFGACFKARLLCNTKLADDARVERLQAGAVHHVPAGIAVGVGRGSYERLGVDPSGGIARAGSEDLLPSEVGANRIFSHDGARVCGISENRDGEGEAGLSLEL